MRKPKLTPWYPAGVNPVHIGIYETRMQIVPEWYRYWDGERWYVGSETPDEACNQFRLNEIAWHRKEWRGLTEPAK